MALIDKFKRRFTYVRLSVTPYCNFRCTYCLPNGNPKGLSKNEFLSLGEIGHLLRALSELGVEKIRLTGGEPLLRDDILQIVSLAAKMPGISQVCLSTNGYRLKGMIPELVGSGLTRLNVSVDSLERETFFRITKQDRLPEILDAIEEAVRWPMLTTKINVVLMKNRNDHEVSDFIRWTKNRPVSLRFIETMPTHDSPTLLDQFFVSTTPFRNDLMKKGWQTQTRKRGDGPAEVLTHPSHKGSIGFIRPYTQHFCDQCNRLRISASGELQLCLFGNGRYSLRPLLQSQDSKEILKTTLCQLLVEKKESHYLSEGNYGSTNNFAGIGG